MSDTEQQRGVNPTPPMNLEGSEQAQAWPFAPSYEASYSGLPPSQLREAMKRLAERRRNPLPVEKLSEENPEIETVLSAVRKAYLAKKDRAKLASAAKRASQKEVAPVEAAPVEVVEDLTASVVDLSLEPAEVVACAEEPEPEPEPTPEPVKPPPSKPIAIPMPKLARQQSQIQQPVAATPRNQPKKVGGLAGRFA